MQQLTLLLASLGIVTTGVIALLGYLGLFKKLNAEIAAVGKFNVLYQELQGSFQVLGSQFAIMEKLMKDHFPDKNREFFGSYADNPYKIKDHSKMRLVFGLVLKTQEDIKRAEIFINKYPNYKIASLPQIKAVKTTFTYKCDLSYMIGARKAYPVMHKYIDSQQYGIGGHTTASFEHYLPSQGIINYYFPIDDTVDDPTQSAYHLTKIPKPEYKEEDQKKRI